MSSTWTKAARIEEELSWWREVYIAALQGGQHRGSVAEVADEAVVNMRELKQRLKEHYNDE